jgi:hypothetical protein
MALELVTWRDAHFSLDDENSEDDFLVETVGWTSEDGRFLRVEGEHLPDDRGARAVSRIPLGMVVGRTILAPVAVVPGQGAAKGGVSRD